jgi:hypothetical protein
LSAAYEGVAHKAEKASRAGSRLRRRAYGLRMGADPRGRHGRTRWTGGCAPGHRGADGPVEWRTGQLSVSVSTPE